MLNFAMQNATSQTFNSLNMNQKLKKQFEQMKAKHPDTVLLFRVGDFYESYEEDAEIVAKELGITLTKKGNTKMAGFPHHSLDNYLPKLVSAGKRVAICDQLEAPKLTKKLVKRGITEDQSSTSSVEQSTSSVEQSTPQVKHFNSPKTMEVKNIPLSDIQPSPLNPRKTFDEEGIRDLADNIRQNGLLQPITIRPVEGKDVPYEIVCGERRYRAFILNQQIRVQVPSDIPCIVRDMTDEEALDAMITENLQRQDVDPIEEAFTFGQLVKTGKSIEEIALRFGKSKRFIQERIKLDNLLPELKQWVTKEWMSIGAAMHVCKLTEDEQQQFFEYMEDTAVQENDPITKQDAIDYTNDLFMRIENAIWERDFSGSCGITCEKCPFNDANVGCLFYEMKPHDATCTNRERWNNKRSSWLLQMITDNADVLVKEGEDLEAGKTIVLKECTSYYMDRCEDFQPLLDKVAGMGFRVAEVDDLFERFSFYQENDERLKAKLEANEVYRCLVISTSYRGTEIDVRYYQWKKNVAAENGDEAKAMQLVNEYRENVRKSAANQANKLCELLGAMDPEELSKEPLSQTESLILLTLILRKASHKFRDSRKLINYSGKDVELAFVREHTDEVHLISRDFIRNELSQSGVQWSSTLQECQSMLLQEWASEKVEEVTTDYALRLAKKQAKIEEQLTALGYNTDGTKMDF